MNKSSVKQTRDARIVRVEFCFSFSCLGVNSAMKLGEDFGCIVKVGMCVLYDLRKADQYFNSLTGVK